MAAAMDPTPSSSEQRHFLTLPAEICHRILTLPFGFEDASFTKDFQSRYYIFNCPRSAQVVAVCRQIRDEALPILYSNTTFCVPTTVDVDRSRMSRHVGEVNVRAIKSIAFHYDPSNGSRLRFEWPGVQVLKERLSTYQWCGSA
jgi:hypothetical protein